MRGLVVGLRRCSAYRSIEINEKVSDLAVERSRESEKRT
jgi:hypothetical protein